MNSTAYTTTLGRNQRLVLPKVNEWVMSSLLNNDGYLVPVYQDNVFKISPRITPSECPVFFLPFTTLYKGDPIVVVDTRNFEKPNGVIRQQFEYVGIVDRGVYEYTWLEERERFTPIADLLSFIYGQWITQAIADRYRPNPLQAEQLKVWFMSYYRLLFLTNQEIENTDGSHMIDLLTRTCVRTGRIAGRIIGDVMDSENFGKWLDSDGSLKSMLPLMNDYIGSSALRFDVPSIINLVSMGSWMGYASTEISGAAVEHPPLLAFMAAGSVDKGNALRTRVGKAVHAADVARLKPDMLLRWVQSFR